MIIDEKKFKILFGLFFLPSIYSLKEPYMAREPWFPNRPWNISQSSKTHATHSYASDWQICKNKLEFSDFWAISYRFEHIVVLIIIQMHFFFSLTTISLLFVWEGHFWIILKRGRGLSPQSPPFCTCLTHTRTHKPHPINLTDFTARSLNSPQTKIRQGLLDNFHSPLTL